MNNKVFQILMAVAVMMVIVPAINVDASEGKVICIDPGHQRKGNNTTEPNAPGSKTMKAKVSSGTQGVSTKKPEYVLVLEISKKLEATLKDRGYQVYMTRTHHDVNLSNIDRAQFCNEINADLTIRVHADGSTNRSQTGIHILYPSGSYTKAINAKSKTAAAHMINELIKATGANKANGDGLSPRTDITGFNWAKYPVVLAEVGFMSNATEDQILSTSGYQDKLAEGMANGVDKYVGNQDSVSVEGTKLLQLVSSYNKAIEYGDMKKVNDLYDSFTKQLRQVEGRIGKISGATNRSKLNGKYVTPAKIAVERTIYEVSQYRLLSSINQMIEKNDYTKVIEDTKKLERLKTRAVGIKQAGNYAQLPSKMTNTLRKSEAETQGLLLNRLLTNYNLAINNGDLTEMNRLYDPFTAQLQLTEAKIGQVSGAANRQELNTAYVRPAKIAVERTIYEVSQLRLLETIGELIAAGNLVEAEGTLPVLDRLKRRAEEIKKAGRYESLPTLIQSKLDEMENSIQENL